ncbi:MAG: 5'/3'-nucleotidase SurE [Candidatus Sumerlaeia bacterium]|nr:5'/3'-nucleotidase SurE [Candidatus Sumerlaeia bacterium]
MSKRKPRILLTNDDGIDAPGLLAIRDTLNATGLYEVLVCAPLRERSGSGCGLSVVKEMRVEARRGADGEVWGYAVDGLPADCVKFAVIGLGGYKPDLVLSGANPGSNIGNSVFYSGTVGCAIESAFFGLRAMAVSIWRRGEPHWRFDTAAGLAAALVPWLLQQSWRRGTFWNLNLPNVALDELKGVHYARQGTAFYVDEFQLQREELDAKYYMNVGKTIIHTPEAPDSDDRVMERGYAALSLLRTDLTVDMPRAAQEALEAEWNRVVFPAR